MEIPQLPLGLGVRSAHSRALEFRILPACYTFWPAFQSGRGLRLRLLVFRSCGADLNLGAHFESVALGGFRCRW